MPIAILPVTINHEDEGLRLLFEFLHEKKKLTGQNFDEFLNYKLLESSIEPRWEFIVTRNNKPIGTISIIKRNINPSSFLFLSIDIEKQAFSDEIKLKIKELLDLQQRNLAFSGLIAYSSKDHIEKFIVELGGRVVNGLYFFELKVSDLNWDLLDSWDNSSLLMQHKLQQHFYDKIPGNLMGAHAALHTTLSNEIKRKDYSWTVEKTAEYTRMRQEMLFALGKNVQLAYLVDEKRNIIGLSKVVIDPANPELASQAITGVSETYRGLGLAKLLKSSMVRRILKIYPQVKYIETDCLKGNETMQLINEKMGFRRKRNKIEKEIIIERLFLSPN